jgi:hypothetical protein
MSVCERECVCAYEYYHTYRDTLYLLVPYFKHTYMYMYVCVCIYVYVCVREREIVRVRARVCVRAHMLVCMYVCMYV